ncbi:helix-turn-helix domain-containing protein [Streptomyces sp. NPDC002814]
MWLSRGLCAGDSYRAIAGLLGRAVSTISREVNNGGRDVYRAIAAQEQALDRARRPKQCLLARRPALKEMVLLLLREEWSPEHSAASGKPRKPGCPVRRVPCRPPPGPGPAPAAVGYRRRGSRWSRPARPQLGRSDLEATV